MPTIPDLSIVVPAYNESARLPRMLRDTRAWLDANGRRAEIIVVDDGSLDDTSGVVRRMMTDQPALRLVRLPQNRGKGFAVRTGVLNAEGSRILFADADGATPIEELLRLEAALDDGAAVAIGSRALASTTTAVKARLLRVAAGRLFHLVVGTLTVRGYRDTQCGFKLFTREAALSIFPRMRMEGFSFDVEVLLLAERLDLAVSEVAVNWEHQPGSKVRVVRDGLIMTRDLFTIRARLLRGDYREVHVHPQLARR